MGGTPRAHRAADRDGEILQLDRREKDTIDSAELSLARHNLPRGPGEQEDRDIRARGRRTAIGLPAQTPQQLESADPAEGRVEEQGIE